MALSDAQKELVRQYTGRSSVDEDSDLERTFASVAARPASEVTVLRLVADCEAVDKQIRDFILTLALATQDGSIELRAAYSLSVMQAVGRQASGRLCGCLSLSMGDFDPWVSALPPPRCAG